MSGFHQVTAFAADTFSIGRPAAVVSQDVCRAPHNQQARRELEEAKRGVLSKYMQGRPELAVLIIELLISMTEADEMLLAQSIEKIKKLPKSINTDDTAIRATLLLNHIRNDLAAYSVARKEFARHIELRPERMDSSLLNKLGSLTYATRNEADGTDGDGAQDLWREALVLTERSLILAKRMDSKADVREINNMQSDITARMAGGERDAVRLASIIDIQRSYLEADLSPFEQSQQIQALMGSLFSYASLVDGQQGLDAVQELNRYIERVKVLNIEIQKSRPMLNMSSNALEIATGRRTAGDGGVDALCLSNANIEFMHAMALVLQQSIVSKTERPDPVLLKQALTIFNKVELAFSLQPNIFRPKSLELFRSRAYRLLAMTESVPEAKAQWMDRARQQLRKSKERLDACFCATERKQLLREEIALSKYDQG